MSPSLDSPPLVSLVLVTNRQSPYLRASLESMQVQSYPHVEIIVVDDGSPDSQGLRDLIGPQVRYVRQSPFGVSAGRNLGVTMARGDLIGFFDDDDVYPVNWVSSHVKRHVEEPQSVLTYTGMRSIGANDHVMMEDPQRQGDIHDFYRRDVSILAGSMIVKRAPFLTAGGFNPLIRYAEDLDMVLRLAHLGPFSYIEGVLRDYRTHDGNVTRRHRELACSIDAVIAFHSALMKVAGRDDLVKDLKVSRAANDRYAAWRAVRVARAHMRQGNRAGALAEVSWLATFAPLAPVSALQKRIRQARKS